MRPLVPLLFAAALRAGSAGAVNVEVLVQTPAGMPLADAAVLVEPLAGTPVRPCARAHRRARAHGRMPPSSSGAANSSRG